MNRRTSPPPASAGATVVPLPPAWPPLPPPDWAAIDAVIAELDREREREAERANQYHGPHLRLVR